MNNTDISVALGELKAGLSCLNSTVNYIRDRQDFYCEGTEKRLRALETARARAVGIASGVSSLLTLGIAAAAKVFS